MGTAGATGVASSGASPSSGTALFSCGIVRDGCGGADYC